MASKNSALEMVARALSDLETIASDESYDMPDPSVPIEALVSCLCDMLSSSLKSAAQPAPANALHLTLWDALKDHKWEHLPSSRKPGYGVDAVTVIAEIVREARSARARVTYLLETLLATGCMHSFILQLCSPINVRDTSFAAQHYGTDSVLLHPSSLNALTKLLRRAETLPWVLRPKGKETGVTLGTQGEADAFVANTPLLTPPPLTPRAGRPPRGRSMSMADALPSGVGAGVGVGGGRWAESAGVGAGAGVSSGDGNSAAQRVGLDNSVTGRARSASDVAAGLLGLAFDPGSLLTSLLSVVAPPALFPGTGTGTGEGSGAQAEGAEPRVLQVQNAGSHASPGSSLWSGVWQGAAAQSISGSVSSLLHDVDHSASPADLLRHLPASALPPAARAYLSDPSRVLSSRTVCMLEACLPAPARGHAWHLAYSLTRDGASLNTLILKTAAAQQRASCGNELSVIAIRDEHGGVFGAFCASAWALPKRGASTATGWFFGSHLAWVFTCEDRVGVEGVRAGLMRAASATSSWEEDEEPSRQQAAGKGGDAASASAFPGTTSGTDAGAGTGAGAGKGFHVYRRTGRNSYMQYIELAKGGVPINLGVGGGGHFSLLLDASLEHGRSGPCATFFSPPLCSLRGMAPEMTEKSMRKKMTAMGFAAVGSPEPKNSCGAAGDGEASSSRAASGWAPPSPRPAVAGTSGESGDSAGSNSDLEGLGPDVPFRAVEVEVWSFCRRGDRDVDMRAQALAEQS